MARKKKTNKVRNYVVAGVMSVVLVSAVVASVGSEKVEAQVGQSGVFVSESTLLNVLDRILDTLAGKEPAPVEPAGGLPGAQVFSSAFTVNGVEEAYRSGNLITATNTPCILQAPAASSTLEHSSLVSNTITTTGKLHLYMADTFATDTNSTLIGSVEVVEGDNIQFVASSTSETSNAKRVISPDHYLIYDYSQATSSLSTDFTGTCKAKFLVL